MNMKHEQANAAVPAMEAAPLEIVENGRERSMSGLLEQMSDEEASEAGQPDAIAEAEPGVLLAETPVDAGSESNPLDKLDRKIARQQQRLDDLKRQKSLAREENNLGAYDEAAEAYLDARDQLRDLHAQRQQTAREEADARRQAETLAREEIAQEYPDALVPGTELYEACNEEMAYLRQANSPLIRDPQVQYRIARRMARALGYQRAPAPAQPRRTVRPVPKGGSPVEPPAATLERRVAGAKSPGAMLELMREIGTPLEKLLKK